MKDRQCFSKMEGTAGFLSDRKVSFLPDKKHDYALGAHFFIQQERLWQKVKK